MVAIDHVAIEGKYLSCLTNYRNRYRAFSHAQSALCHSSIVVEQAKYVIRDFAELVMHVESSLEECIHVFKLAELHDAYENCLNNLNK